MTAGQAMGTPWTYSSAADARNRPRPPSSLRSDPTTVAVPPADSAISWMPIVNTGCALTSTKTL
jgi:hypothetical protein